MEGSLNYTRYEESEQREKPVDLSMMPINLDILVATKDI